MSKVPYHEPLLPALGGLTGIESHIEKDLDDWNANKVVPLFVFDGQQLSGQDLVASQHGIRIHPKTDAAWELYFDGKATDAVSAFGAIGGGSFTLRVFYAPIRRRIRYDMHHADARFCTLKVSGAHKRSTLCSKRY